MSLPPDKRSRIAMFVRNNCISDARVLKEARALADHGYDVHIMATLVGTDIREERAPGVTVHRVPLTPLGHPLGRAAEILLQAGIWSTLFMISAIQYLRGRSGKAVVRKTPLHELARELFAFYVRSIREARRFEVEVFHGHDLTGLVPAYIAGWLGRGKVVYDSHELFTDRGTSYTGGLERKATLAAEHFLIRRMDAVITVNPWIADILKERYRLALTPTVVMNCPAFERTEPSGILHGRLGLDPKTKVILYIGGVGPKRGVEELIEAVPHVREGMLVILGAREPERIALLQSLVKERNLEHRVMFAPPVPFEDVTRFAASADVSVIPFHNVCLNNYYCSPNKLFESIMAGVPLATSRFPFLQEVVEREGIGRLFDPEDPRDIARALNEILGDDDLRAQMRRNAVLASERYTWEREAEKLVAVYQELVSLAQEVATR